MVSVNFVISVLEGLKLVFETLCALHRKSSRQKMQTQQAAASFRQSLSLKTVLFLFAFHSNNGHVFRRFDTIPERDTRPLRHRMTIRQ